ETMPTKLAAILLTLLIGLTTLTMRLDTNPAVLAAGREALLFDDQRDSVRAAVFWLVEQYQNDDGGYASFSNGANQSPSTIGGTLDATLAIAGAGYNPSVVFATKTNT